MPETPAMPPELPPAPPMIVVVSGPSGVGKTVICERLIAGDATLVPSVSATTRPPRATEKDGVEYFFYSEERFRKEIEAGTFLEWAEVHGRLYGTPRQALETNLRAGKSPVLDVDVQGGRSVKRLRPDAVLILVAPPSMEELERRLRHRGTDDDDAVRRRLAHAARELAAWPEYDYLLVNDSLEVTVEQAQAVLVAERARVARRRGMSD